MLQRYFLPTEHTELRCDSVRKTNGAKPALLLPLIGGIRASTQVDVFDIQGRELVGKTQQRIPCIINANMPMVQKNQTNETLGAERGEKTIPKLCATCHKTTASVV